MAVLCISVFQQAESCHTDTNDSGSEKTIYASIFLAGIFLFLTKLDKTGKVIGIDVILP
jgi:hypothetical protein